MDTSVHEHRLESSLMHFGLVILVVRVVFYLLNKRKGGASAPTAPMRVSVARLGLGIFSFSVRAVCLGLALGAWGDTGHFFQWPVLLLLALALPQALLSGFLIPLGVPYLTYWFARVTFPFATVAEGRGGALFNELRARLAWNRLLGPTRTSHMQGVICFHGVSDRTVGGATLCVQGMLDAIAGQRENARDLFAIAQSMSPWHAPRSARVFAQAWLMADAAQRGAYHELLRDTMRGPRTRRRWFLAKIARRLLLGTEAPTKRELWLAWLIAPARRHTFGLLQQALATSPRNEIKVAGTGLATARRATLELERTPPGLVTRAELRQLATAWQTVFESGELRERLARRRDELQASFDSETLAARFEQDIIEILARAWRYAPPDEEPESTDPMLVLAAKDALQSELLAEIESLCAALPRGSERVTDDLEQHFRTWGRVRTAIRAFLDVLPEREPILYPSVGLNILNHGAWLYNKERARILSHDVFRFLLPITPKGDPNRRTVERNAAISR